MQEEGLVHSQRRGAGVSRRGGGGGGGLGGWGGLIILIVQLLLAQHDAFQTIAAQCIVVEQVDQKNQTEKKKKRVLSNLRGGTLLHLALSCNRMNTFTVCF